MTSEINTLLKRVALFYYPRAQVAQLHGEAWLNFLNHTFEARLHKPKTILHRWIPQKLREKTMRSGNPQQPLNFHAVQTELLTLPYQKSGEILPVEHRVARIKPLLVRTKAWINLQKPGRQHV